MGSTGTSESLDVLIVGAGISGINTAHYLQSRGPAGLTYTILERRGRMGGTWDLFQYPGIRSDSDIFTFGFSWNPWKGDVPIVSGPKICAYLNESAALSGIDTKIRYYHRVISADWSSESSTWSVKAKRGKDDEEGKEVVYRAKFIVLGTGYYDYDQPFETTIPGIESFKGPVIQPQFWPSDLNYTNKDVVVIGSGATAVTLVPSLAEDAKHTTMLQRSPTYIYSLPMKANLLTKLIRWLLPRKFTGHILRMHFALRQALLYHYCQWFPKAARRLIMGRAKKQLPPGYKVDPHFNPRYGPWDQRLCFVPDGDFFAAIRSRKASVVTDTIDTVTEDSIRLRSGEVLRPEIIVASTGIKLSFAGGIKISIDGVPYDPASKYAFKACMLQDAPNLAFIIGYANASWTLGAESTAVFLTRLWSTMASKDIKAVVPRAQNPEKMEPLPPLGLTSTYVKAGAKHMPMGGEGLWAPRRNHLRDMYDATWCSVLEGLETH
jgi:cation diffusion facilitator CzcD-associated flavoprotein CzcO